MRLGPRDRGSKAERATGRDHPWRSDRPPPQILDGDEIGERSVGRLQGEPLAGEPDRVGGAVGGAHADVEGRPVASESDECRRHRRRLGGPLLEVLHRPEYTYDASGDYVFGEGTERLEAVVGRLLSERGMSLAVAESCTGGLIGSRITDIAGSSDYFRGGVVSYSNLTKWSVISVDRSTLDTHGAVSRQTAEQMARGVRKLLDADVGLATTGIMGPGGGSEDKPVGTLWMGLSLTAANVESTLTEHVRLGTDRETNKKRAATAALNMLRRRLSASGD